MTKSKQPNNVERLASHGQCRLGKLNRISPSDPIMILMHAVHSAMVNNSMLGKPDLPLDVADYIKDESGLRTGLKVDSATAAALRKLVPENKEHILVAVTKMSPLKGIEAGIRYPHNSTLRK